MFGNNTVSPEHEQTSENNIAPEADAVESLEQPSQSQQEEEEEHSSLGAESDVSEDRPVQPWQPGEDIMFQWDFLPKQPLNATEGVEPATPVPQPGFITRYPEGYEWIGSFGKKVLRPPPPSSPPPPPAPAATAATEGEPATDGEPATEGEPASEEAPPPAEAPPHAMEFKESETFSEEVCKEALTTFAESGPYDKNLPTQYKTVEVKPCNYYEYTLETFCESRLGGMAHAPFKGLHFDSEKHGAPPDVWDIECEPDQMFTDNTKHIEVPRTGLVKDCFSCEQNGFVRCWKCQGMGQLLCIGCDGKRVTKEKDAKGKETKVECKTCGGYNGSDGRQQCEVCEGDGRLVCEICWGYRKIKCFVQLTVIYVNHKEEFKIEKTGMPGSVLSEVEKESLFEQTLPRVQPVTTYPIPEINNNSKRLVEKHRGSWPDERCLNERQRLLYLPVTEVGFTYKDLNTSYWVMGKQRTVHCPEYPQEAGCKICSVL